MSHTDITVKELLEKYAAGERDFKAVRVTDANVIANNLCKANLSGANFENACFRGAYLIETNLSGANLFKTDLTNACLVEANLSGAQLTFANLVEANLNNADLTGADLTIANLINTDLTNATLSGVKPPLASHVFWGEALAQKATNLEQQQVACLVASGNRFGWCWKHFLSWEHPLEQWAIQAIFSLNIDFSNYRKTEELLRSRLTLPEAQIHEVKLRLNDFQLNLLHDWCSGAKENLQEQRWEWDSSEEEDENHRQTFGTTDFEEAQELLEDIHGQITENYFNKPNEPQQPDVSANQ